MSAVHPMPRKSENRDFQISENPDFRSCGSPGIRKSGFFGFPEFRIFGNRISEIPGNLKIRIFGCSDFPDFREIGKSKIPVKKNLKKHGDTAVIENLWKHSLKMLVIFRVLLVSAAAGSSSIKANVNGPDRPGAHIPDIRFSSFSGIPICGNPDFRKSGYAGDLQRAAHQCSCRVVVHQSKCLCPL